MPEHSKVDMDDDIVQAYLHFKERDYTACLRILEDNIVFFHYMRIMNSQTKRILLFSTINVL